MVGIEGVTGVDHEIGEPLVDPHGRPTIPVGVIELDPRPAVRPRWRSVKAVSSLVTPIKPAAAEVELGALDRAGSGRKPPVVGEEPAP